MAGIELGVERIREGRKPYEKADIFYLVNSGRGRQVCLRSHPKTEISEADVTRVGTGQKVYFTTLGEPDKRFRSPLRTVEPAPAAIASQAASSSNASAAATAATASALYYTVCLKCRIRTVSYDRR